MSDDLKSLRESLIDFCDTCGVLLQAFPFRRSGNELLAVLEAVFTVLNYDAE